MRASMELIWWIGRNYPVGRRLDRHGAAGVSRDNHHSWRARSFIELMLGPEKSIGWGTIAVLVLLTLGVVRDSIFSAVTSVRNISAPPSGECSARCSEALIGHFLRDRRIICWPGDWRDRRSNSSPANE